MNTPIDCLEVLIPVHEGADSLDFIGPHEFLSSACFPTVPSFPSATNDNIPEEHRAFFCTIATKRTQISTEQCIQIVGDKRNADCWRIREVDILLIPGGSALSTIASATLVPPAEGELDRPSRRGRSFTPSDPFGLIKSFVGLPGYPISESDPRPKERILFSVCTGSLFLAKMGVLRGLTATTHPSALGKLRELCEEAEADADDGKPKTRVVPDSGDGEEEVRFVVNPVDEATGLRVITAGGLSCGLDAALWIVEHFTGEESRRGLEGLFQYKYRRGMVIEG